MGKIFSKQRIYASIVILGAGFLFFRTIRMIFVEQAFDILVFWVVALLILESLLDLLCIIFSFRWLGSNKVCHAALPLKLLSTAVIVHAIRVSIFVLGRTGPWFNFDVQPEYREAYTFDWFWVYIAGVLSFLSIVAMVMVWNILRRKK